MHDHDDCLLVGLTRTLEWTSPGTNAALILRYNASSTCLIIGTHDGLPYMDPDSLLLMTRFLRRFSANSEMVSNPLQNPWRSEAKPSSCLVRSSMQSPNSPSADWDQVFSFPGDVYDRDDGSFATIAADMTMVTAATGSNILTPPTSKQSSPTDIQETIVSVSTIFYPGATHTHSPPDLILLSQDSVFFYVHSQKLLEASLNGFNSTLPLSLSQQQQSAGNHSIIMLPENAEIINVVLHTMYMMSCTQFSPSLDCIIQAVDVLAKYGAPLKTYIAPSTPLYSLILARAPLFPIELYAVAAQNDLLELATAISSHLLAFNLSNLTDELALKIGPIYLKRLFFLHLGRNDALKRLLLSPPALHGPTPQCDFTEQKKLTRAWALATAYLAWDARPDLSTSAIEYALGSLEEHLTCPLCRSTMKSRLKQLIVEWSNVKRTI